MPATYKRLEVWSDYQCAGGKRLAVVADVLALVERATLDAGTQLTCVIPITSVSAPQVIERRVFRVVQDDTTFDEWRLLLVDFDTQEGLYKCTALPVLADLATKGLVSSTDSTGVVAYVFDGVGLTPTQHLTNFVLPALSSSAAWVSLGTVTPSTPLDISYNYDTALSATRKVAEASAMELTLRRNGTTGYLIDVIAQIGSSAPVADLRFGKNILKNGVKRDATKQITRIIPKGGEEGGTMASAVWKVSAIAGSVVSLVDPAGGDGPIAMDGQIVGTYLRKVDTSLTVVNASSASGQNVTVGVVAGIAVGDLIQFRLDGSGTGLTYLDSVADIATYGRVMGVLDAPDVPITDNRVPNPVFRTWLTAANVLPTGWTLVGGAATITKTTAAPYIRRSPNSAKVDTTANGMGIQTPAALIKPSVTSPYGSVYAGIYVVSGSVKVEFIIHSNATGVTTVLPTGTIAVNSIKGAWIDLGVAGIDINNLQASDVYVRITQEGATASSFYVDSAQATNSATQQTFVEGSGGTILWQRANRALKTMGIPARAYDVSVADLARLNPNVYSGDSDLVLGGTVRVQDARMVPGPLNKLTDATSAMLTDGDGNGIADNWAALAGGAAGVAGSRAVVADGQRIVVTAGPSSAVADYYGVVYAFPCKPGDVLDAEVQALVEAFVGGGRAQMYTYFTDNVGASLGFGLGTFTQVTTGWTTLKRGALVAPAGAAFYQVQLYVSMPGAIGDRATVRFANMQVRILNEGFLFSTRVVEIVKNYLVPADTRITLSSRPEDLIDATSTRLLGTITTTVLAQGTVGSGTPGAPGTNGTNGTNGFSQGPSASVVFTGTADVLTQTVALGGALPAGSTGTLQYRYRIDLPTAVGSWSNSGAFVTFTPPVNVGITKDFRYIKTVVLEVKDSATGLSTLETLEIEPLWNFVVPMPPSTQGLFPNPGFEDGSNFWEMASGFGSIITDSTKAKTGNKYGQISVASGSNAGFYAGTVDGSRRYMEVEEGQVVKISGWAYRESGDGNCRWSIGVYDKDKLNPVFTGATVTAAAWTQVNYEYTVPAGKKYLILFGEISGATVATVGRFDDCAFEILAAAADITAGILRNGMLDSLSRKLVEGLSKGAGNEALSDILDNVVATGTRRAVANGAVDASGNVNLAGTAFVNQLVASRILAANLAAISANLGTVTAGIITNATTPTRAIRLNSAYTLPANLTSWIDLDPAAGGFILRFGTSVATAVLTLDTAGNLVVAGVIKPSQLQQLATGSATLAGSLLATGTSVFGETIATLTAGERLDLSGGRLRFMKDALSRFELGNFNQSAGATLTAKTDNSWPVITSGTVTNASPASWSVSNGASAGPDNAIAVATDLPDYNNQYTLDFRLNITVTWPLGHTMVDAGQTRARLYTSKVGGGVAANWKDQGIIATLTHSGARNAGVNQTYTGIPVTIPAADLDAVTASNSHFKIVPEIYCPYGDDGVGGPATPSASGTATTVDLTDTIRWSKSAGGSTFARRMPFFKAINAQPHFAMEPLTNANLPADNAGADGEVAYSSTDHALFVWDGIRRGLVQPEVFKHILAANAATTSTTGAVSVGLDLVVQAGEIWELEWTIEMILSVTTATLGFNVASTGTFTTRSGFKGECTAGAPNTGAGICRMFESAAGTATGTAGGMGNPGSSVLGVPAIIRARVKIATSGTLQLLIASSSGTVQLQEGSRMSAWRIA